MFKKLLVTFCFAVLNNLIFFTVIFIRVKPTFDPILHYNKECFLGVGKSVFLQSKKKKRFTKFLITKLLEILSVGIDQSLYGAV